MDIVTVGEKKEKKKCCIIGVAICTATLRIICLMLLIRTAAQPLCRAADNQSQYLIYTM